MLVFEVVVVRKVWLFVVRLKFRVFLVFCFVMVGYLLFGVFLLSLYGFVEFWLCVSFVCLFVVLVRVCHGCVLLMIYGFFGLFGMVIFRVFGLFCV